MTAEIQEESGSAREGGYPGAYVTFLGVTAMGYVLLLAFVFGYGIHGEALTAGVDQACAEAAFKSGKDIEARGNHELAIQRYHQALAGQFRDVGRRHECARSIGEALYRLGRYEEAVEAYRQLPPEAFSQPGHWTGYVSSLLSAGDDTEAERLGKVWLSEAERAQDTQQMVWARAALGQLYERMNRPGQALEQYEAASTLQPESQATLMAARILQQQGQTELAVQKLEALLETVKSGELHEEARRLHARLTGKP